MLVLLAGFTGVDAARACSLGSGVLEDDLAHAFQAVDEVFVARLTSYRKVPPGPGGEYMLVQSDYELVETLKGHPQAHGVLVEADPYSPLPGHAPGPACGPWVVHAGSVGHTALVLAHRWTDDNAGGLDVHPYSRRIDVSGTGADEVLAIVRKLSLQAGETAP
ncbi:hypothetical protein [Pseudoxanthomonas putridarboris]|uniref:Uncharacterized protein n=1 Tax=Pseudoxanthomonas putridarboris TaxID=752605 RepID=A0ABU9J1V0_9GAMM